MRKGPKISTEGDIRQVVTSENTLKAEELNKSQELEE